jgi:hypothetical protein
MISLHRAYDDGMEWPCGFVVPRALYLKTARPGQYGRGVAYQADVEKA